MRLIGFLATLACAALPVLAQGLAPPAPDGAVDYRLVLRQGAGGGSVEIRKQGSRYRHMLLGVEPKAVIHYDAGSGDAVVIDGAQTHRLRLAPGELGGIDAAAMMARLSEDAVSWEAGGEREVADATCRDYTGTGRRAGAVVSARFCVTQEGIVLAFSSGGPGQIGRAMQAVEFEIGSQPAELFRVPEAAAGE